MKKALTIILAAALLASMCACSKNTSNDAGKDSQSVENFDLQTDENGNYVDENGNAVYSDDLFEETRTISEGGTDKGLWPSDEIPGSVPAFDGYSVMYTSNYQKSDKDEVWLLGFDTDKEGYDSYLQALSDNGFRKSEKIAGFWANGEVIVDVQTESNGDGTVFLSIDVYKSAPVEFPEELKDKFPTFETDSTVYYWRNSNGKLDIAYVCGSDFEGNLEKYKEKLTSDGFTVSDGIAKKEDSGKTYVVEFEASKYEDNISFSCNG